MANTWILDVLADLKAFAEANDLPRLAEQLAETEKVAESEIATSEDEGKTKDGEKSRNDTQRLASCQPA